MKGGTTIMFRCPVCKSKDVRKRGFRKNSTGKKQKYQCFHCEKWFVRDDGFKRMRYKPEIISGDILLHVDRPYLFKVQYHLWQHEGIKVSRKTILLWERKYSVFLKSDKQTSYSNHQRKYSL